MAQLTQELKPELDITDSTRISMAKIKTVTIKYGRESQWIVHSLLVGMQNGTAILENSLTAH